MRLSFLAGLGIAFGASAQTLNDTGSLACIDGAGNFLASCAATGQDGSAGRDVGFPDPADGLAGFSYRKVCHSGELAGSGSCPADPVLGPASTDWGCTLDNVTGLMWEIKTTDGGLRDRQRVYTHLLPGASGYGGTRDATGFVNEVNAAGMCGSQDWSLPSRLQLESLMNYGLSLPGPVLDTRFFPNSVNRAHWSRDPSAAGTPAQPASVGVETDTGDVSWNKRSFAYPVRLVRATVPLPAGARFTISSDGQEVSDAYTGLTWRRCVEGATWNGSTCTGTAKSYPWLQALNRSNNQAAIGGWRMPNVRELSSLVDDSRNSPSIDSTVFPATPTKWFWSSTPVSDDPSYVWSVQFRDGRVASHAQRNTGYLRHLRLVRGGL